MNFIYEKTIVDTLVDTIGRAALNNQKVLRVEITVDEALQLGRELGTIVPHRVGSRTEFMGVKLWIV